MKTLVPKKERFLTDENGKRIAVVIDLKTYDRLREAEEELADIRAFDMARPRALRDIKAGRSMLLSEYRAKRIRSK